MDESLLFQVAHRTCCLYNEGVEIAKMETNRVGFQIRVKVTKGS